MIAEAGDDILIRGQGNNTTSCFCRRSAHPPHTVFGRANNPPTILRRAYPRSRLSLAKKETGRASSQFFIYAFHRALTGSACFHGLAYVLVESLSILPLLQHAECHPSSKTRTSRAFYRPTLLTVMPAPVIRLKVSAKSPFFRICLTQS